MTENEKSLAHKRRESRKKAQPSGMGRREFLKVSATALGIAAFGGVIYELSKIIKNNPKDESVMKYINSFYPEMRNQKTRQSIEYVNDEGIKTTIINYSSSKINENAIIDTYKALDNLARKYDSQSNEITLNGRNLTFAIKPSKKDRVLFIAGGNIPSPSWALNDSAVTNIGKNENLSFIKLGNVLGIELVPGNFENIPGLYNSALISIEACQSSVVVGSNSDNVEDHMIIQEMLCNSLGRALGLRQSGVNYEGYINVLNNTPLARPGDTREYGTISLNKEDYLLLPTETIFIDK